MGIKYTDILMKHHDHDHFMKYMRAFRFREFAFDFFEDDEDKPADNYKIEEETFPMQKTLEIDSHETYSWQCDMGKGRKSKEEITLETNASVPWARIAVREAALIDANDWAEKLSLTYPKADVLVLSYHSVSDHSSVTSYRRGKCVRLVSFDFETNPMIQWSEGEGGVAREPWEAWIEEINRYISADDDNCDYSPTNFTYYYWTHLFPEIPVRYSLTEYAWKSHGKTLEHLQNVIEANPEYYGFWLEKGHILSEIGKYKEAIKVFQRVLELKPDYTVWQNLALAHIGLEDYDKAIECYDRSIKSVSGFSQYRKEKINKQNVKTYTRMAEIMVDINGNYERAIEYCDEAIKHNPNSVIALYNIGLVYHKCNQEKKAKEYYDKALYLDKNYIKAINNKIVILLNRKKYQKALEYANEALRNIDEKYINILNSKGIALHYLKKYKKSLTVYKKIIEYNPNSEKGYWGVACEYSYLKEYKKSIFYYQKALCINPASYMFLSNIGNNLNNMGRYGEALEYLEKSIKINPNYYHPYYYKACVFALTGREKEALQMVKETLRLDPSQKETLKKEPDLKNLRNNKMFKKLVNSSYEGWNGKEKKP